MTRLTRAVPAVAAGRGPFTVLDCAVRAGGCSAEPTPDSLGLFVAPLQTGSEQALAIRQHEYGHLGLLQRGVVPRHTLASLAAQGFHELWVQGVLDAVVNAYMLSRGSREIASLDLGAATSLARWQGAVQYLRYEGLAAGPQARRALTASCGFTAWEMTLLARAAATLRRLGVDARPISVNQLSQLLHELHRTFGPFAAQESASPAPEERPVEGVEQGPGQQATAEAHPRPAPSHEAPRERPGAAGPAPRPSGGSTRSERLRRYRRRARLAEARRGAAGTAGIELAWTQESADVRSGAMSVLQAPLARSGKRGRGVRRVGPGYAGPFRYPHRAMLPGGDGQAFGTVRRVSGGTVLVDCSGSMRIDAADIARMLERRPAATVALYASLPGSLAEGRLVVVAARGRVAEFSDLKRWLGHGNVVDIPALEWLCGQRGPRTWISDGIVTGVGDRTSGALQVRAATLVRQGCIAVVESLAAYLGVDRAPR